MRRDPRCFGLDRTRWTRALVGRVVPWLGSLSLASIGRALRSVGVVLRRARDMILSPDPAFAAKQAAVAASVRDARTAADPAAGPAPSVVTLYLDEVTVYRQPTLAPAYAAQGATAPASVRSHASDTPTRLVATLDAVTGQVCACRRTRITVATLVTFFQEVVAAYPDAARIDVVLDNWPVHFHPDLLVALQPQDPVVPFHRPPSWPTTPRPSAVARWGHLQLPIRLIPLPTYASWLNRIERLWHLLRQEVTHLHPWADDLPALRGALDQTLARFAAGSPDLLRYTGLQCPE